MASPKKVMEVIKRRPTYFYPYLRQTWLFYQTRFLYRLFRPEGVDLGKNVRIQSFQSLRVEVPNSRIRIGDHSIVWEGSVIEAVGGGRVEIGAYADLAGPRIFARELVQIGDYVTLANNTYIQDCPSHPMDPELRKKERTERLEYFSPRFDLPGKPEKRERPQFATETKPIIIEDNVIIYRNCLITRGVTIGKNSVIAANSTVIKDIPPNCFAAGVPAKVIREL